MKVILYKKFANCEIFRDEHRAQWVHSHTPSQVEKVPSSQFQAKRLSFQRHPRLMIAPSKQYSKSQAWSNSKVHRKDSFRSSEDSSVCPIMSINVNRSGDPAINGYSFLWFINNPNISTPQLVIAARWASPSIGSILILPHPQIGFVLGSSVTSQAQKYLPAGSIVWYESVFSDERERESDREQEKKGEWATPFDCVKVVFTHCSRSILSGAQRPFVFPCAAWRESKCESSSCDQCASEMWKFSFEMKAALDERKKCDLRRKGLFWVPKKSIPMENLKFLQDSQFARSAREALYFFVIMSAKRR